MDNVKDGELLIDEKVNSLLNKMSLKEKAAQLTQFFGRAMYEKKSDTIEMKEFFKKALSGNGIGLLYGVQRCDAVAGVNKDSILTWKQSVKLLNEIQKINMENTPHKIPLLFAEECSHGLMAYDATVYPVPLCIGCSFNDRLYEKMTAAIAEEARYRGVTITYSPVFECVRDIRWGRTEETFGEDTYLCMRMGLKGMDGLTEKGKYGKKSVVPAVKHFAVHGCPEGGINVAYTSVGQRELNEVWLEPFKRAVEHGARALITSYNEIDGVPMCANKELIKDTLKDKWNFNGFVFSDLGAVEMLKDVYHVAKDYKQATLIAFKSGIDIDMLGECYNNYLAELVEDGKITLKELDDAVKRILKLKFELGLFESPYIDEKKTGKKVRNKAGEKIALDMAREGIVLLKNEDNILPLNENQNICLIGPNADNVYNQLGDYTAFQNRKNIVTIKDGMEKFIKNIPYASGCKVRSGNEEMFSEAKKIIEKSQIVIAVMGGSSSRFDSDDCIDSFTGQAIIKSANESDMECGEGVDRCTLTLPNPQLDLLKEVVRQKKKLIVVYISGRPISDPFVDEYADAVFYAPYPGQYAGLAVAELIFGKINPSGRLCLSIPKDAGQLPLYYCRKPSVKLKQGYVEMDAEAKYEFGFGLSYTDFAFGELKIIKADKNCVTAKINVTNIGNLKGKETVQLYLSKEVSEVTRPEFLLKGFEKVELEPNETKTVKFKLTYNELKVFGKDNTWKVESGKYCLSAGKSSKNIISKAYFVL